MYTSMSKSNIMAYANNSFTFSLAYYVSFLFNTDCLSSIFHLDCPRCADLRFSLILFKKKNAVEGELHQSCDYITNVINP